MIDWSKIRLTDINAKNIRSFVEGTINKTKYALNSADEDLIKMIESRIDKCPECKEKGSCVVCGCDYKGMISAPLKECPKGKWTKWNNNAVTNIDNYQIDLDLSKSQTATIPIVNTTNQEIIIKDIFLSCDCVTISSKTFDSILPGKHINIEINFDITRIAINETRLMSIEFQNTSLNKHLNLNEKHKTFIFKRIK